MQMRVTFLRILVALALLYLPFCAQAAKADYALPALAEDYWIVPE